MKKTETPIEPDAFELLEEQEWTEREKEEVSPVLLADALVLLKRIVKGNGIKTANVKFEAFEGEVLNFEAQQVFKVEPDVSERLLIGKQGADIVSGSENDARHKIKALAEGATKNPDVIENTIEILKKRNDLGYGIDDHKFLLERMSKSISVHQVCTVCSGSATNRCAYCKGRGEIMCPRCHGSNEKGCPECMGRQFQMGPNGKQIPCHQCHGRGKVGCDYCREKGEVHCPKCKSTGNMPCKDCSNTGWHSLFITMKIRAHSQFDYEEERLPEEIIPMLDDLGSMLVVDEHAKVVFIEDKERLAELEKESKHNEFTIPYHVRLPWGDVEFSINGEPLKGQLFGFQPSLLYLPPFLEEIISPGLKSLRAAAHHAAMPTVKIRQALKYRAVADAFLWGGRFSRKKAMHLMRRKYTVGLTDKTIDDMVIYADTALKKVTERPRKKGLFIGLVIVTILYAAYYIGPLRGLLVSVLIDTELQKIVDFVLVLIGGAITTYAIQKTATKAMFSAIGPLLTKEKEKHFLPKAGYSALWGYGGGLLIYFIMLELAARLGNDSPLWYEEIRASLGFF